MIFYLNVNVSRFLIFMDRKMVSSQDIVVSSDPLGARVSRPNTRQKSCACYPPPFSSSVRNSTYKWELAKMSIDPKFVELTRLTSLTFFFFL